MTQETVSFHRQRPLSFNVLCVLAFGFGGMSILANLYLILSGTLTHAYRSIPAVERVLGLAVINFGVFYSVIGLFLSIGAFFGVIQMWNQLKLGFWVFSLSKFAYIVLPFLLLNFPFIHIFYLMLPLFIIVSVFIILFSFNFKYLD